MQIYDNEGLVFKDLRAFGIEAFIFSTNYTSLGESLDSENAEISLEKCSNESIDEPYFTNQGFKDYLCPIFNFSFGGTLSNSRMIEPYINIVRCGKADEDKNFKCYTDDELITKYGYLFYLSIRIQNNFLNPRNCEEPVIKNYIEKGYYIATTGSENAINIAHKIASLTSDTGLIFEDENTIDFFQIEEASFYTIATIEKGKSQLSEFQTIFQIAFFISRNIISFKREYLKIPDAYSIFLYQNLFRLEIGKEDDNNKQEIHNKIELNPMSSLKLIENLNNIGKDHELSLDKVETKRLITKGDFGY